ncbi:MAG: hypothetical protein WD845_03350 [Pirellulales bacterium]
MDDNWIVIYRADEVQQAHFMKGLLIDHDIDAHVMHNRQIDLGNVVTDLGVHGLSHQQHAEARVLVRQSDAEAAYELVESAQRNLSEGLSSPDLAALEEEADRHGQPWPLCPDCRRPRLTSCPVCQTAGTSFPAAFHPEHEPSANAASEDAPLLVLCTTCDEPFAPEFPARCEWCGHRFADGREAEPFEPSEPVDINVRVIAAIVGVVLTVVGLIAFFARIAS